MVRHLSGAYCIAVAAALAANLAVSPLYGGTVLFDQVWAVFDWLMAAGLAVAMVSAVADKVRLGRAGDDEMPYTKRRLDVNVFFHATLLLTLLFLWNWSSKWMSQDSAMMWTVIDAAAVAVLGSTGFRLWNGRGRG